MEAENERQVPFEEAAELAHIYEMDYSETSAKSDEGVKELMENMFESLLKEKLQS
eukprot:CAMPEP_0170456436 /NCGR_PEP_ID=MMETSP0123-20130129/4070_1 /TAXON_ID=182087 /ORGANISM="Favella ehrenbergii, Strain Fehren 1" /LENGTH=54 /DNA_ID=CAMNT_0010719911 /DNA_START=365 /DNA_END=529 /DNA_ORIENTATION=-